MKNATILLALAAMAFSAPTMQGNASPVTEHVIVTDSTTEQNAFAQAQGFVLRAHTLEAATLTALGAQLAPGCCDQSYPAQHAVSASNCCDQSYPVHQASALPKPLLALVFASALLLMWTYTNHFKRTTARWISQH